MRPISTYYSGHKIVLIIRTEVTEDALPGLPAWEPLNGLSNNLKCSKKQKPYSIG